MFKFFGFQLIVFLTLLYPYGIKVMMCSLSTRCYFLLSCTINFKCFSSFQGFTHEPVAVDMLDLEYGVEAEVEQVS